AGCVSNQSVNPQNRVRRCGDTPYGIWRGKRKVRPSENADSIVSDGLCHLGRVCRSKAAHAFCVAGCVSSQSVNP
ncbi:hypothetical protein, partial [Kingella potus]|uniref:hypothetical protein n=1 Tax=Kingella potus TaxID=265175 RepID=UPI003D1A003B